MSPSENAVNLTFQLNAGESYDPEELDLLTRQLLTEVKELDVQSAALVQGGETPSGAKSGDLVTLGTLAVTVLPAMLPKLFDLVQSWSMRSANRRVRIKAQVDNRSIEVDYSPATMSTDELKRLVSTLSEALPPVRLARYTRDRKSN